MAQGEGMTELMSWFDFAGWLSSSNGWKALSADEWKYLVGDNQLRKGLYAKHVTVVGVADCLIIYPDGYEGTKVTDDNRTTLYNDSTIWAQAQNDGVVCLTPVRRPGYDWAFYWISKEQMLYANDNENRWIWNTGTGGFGPYAARPVTEVK